MSKPININKPGEEINLKARRFRIYILGGFGVSLGKFSISFKHKKTNYSTKCEKAFWPVQAYAFGRRARRIFIVDIQKEGQYEILFKNPETLTVKHSNLPLVSMMRSPIAHEQLEILITEKLGFYPILTQK